MKKWMACLSCMLVFAILVGMCGAIADTQFSFEQTVGFINAIAIDGENAFTNGRMLDIEEEPYASYLQEAEVVFIWMDDIDGGRLLLLNKEDPQSFYEWECNSKETVEVVLEVLCSVLQPCLDLEDGESILFVSANSGTPNDPSAYIVYSENDGLEEAYSDPSSFQKAVCSALEGSSGQEDGAKAGEYPVLKKGSKGDEVQALQERLNDLGYSVGKADGDFGKKTKSAVEAFQKANGLEVTGIADEKTQELLFSDNAIRPTPSPEPTAKPTRAPKATEKPGSTSSTKYSKSECVQIAEAYLRRMYTGVSIQLSDATVDDGYCLVVIQYSKGFSIGIIGIMVDMTTGSVVYTKSA